MALAAGTGLPRWRVVVVLVAAIGSLVLAAAVAEIAVNGLRRPWTVAVGLVATIVVNRVYVVVARRGQVVEGIDIAEAAIVALALLLPAGEAVIAFAGASIVIELFADRARVKKIFNVGVRAAGAGPVVLAVAVAGRHASPTASEYVAAVIGAIGYALVNAIAVAAVISSVHRRSLRSVLSADLTVRLLAWGLAVAIGCSSGYAALRAPAALPAVMAALVLVLLAAIAAETAQRECRRVQHLLDATTRIQEVESPEEQEDILLEVAGELLLWKDVDVRDEAPQPAAFSAPLEGGTGQRWLVATPRLDSDPWTPGDQQVLETLAAAATAARDRADLRAELARQALLDPLTGAANRRRLDECLSELCASEHPEFSLILCDLDHFKSVNDRLGHDAGDELLRVAHARLSSCVRAQDLVARLGGDEFVVVLRGVVSPSALEVVKAKISARFAEPVRVGRWQLSCLPSSLGVVTAPRERCTPRDVLRAADESMYDVKRARRATPSPVPAPRSEVRRREDRTAEPRPQAGATVR